MPFVERGRRSSISASKLHLGRTMPPLRRKSAPTVYGLNKPSRPSLALDPSKAETTARWQSDESDTRDAGEKF